MNHYTWEQVIEDMKSCEQSLGQSVYQHGRSVEYWYSIMDEILAYGYHDSKNETLIGKDKFILPDWWFKYELCLANRHSRNIMLWYTTYHDVGKPYCLEIDSDGRRHFPNHAEKSYEVWMELIKDSDQDSHFSKKYAEKTKGQIIGDLILHDMDIHKIKADDIDALIRSLGERTIVSLLLVALCEIHSNAEMFGGVESVSFKMKWKQIDRRGKAICKKLFDHRMGDFE